MKNNPPTKQNFLHLYQNLNGKNVQNKKDAIDYIQAISLQLLINGNWKIQTKAITKLLELIKGNILTFSNINIEKLTDGILKCLSDSRPFVVQPAAVLVTILSQNVQEFQNKMAGFCTLT